jgi:hypothetical protein
MPARAERGQVLIIFAILLVLLLGFAGFAIDIGRQVAERRHVQTAADAGALAACRAIIAGSSDSTAAAAARDVALANLADSPSDATASMDSPATYADEDGDAIIGADELASGIVIGGTTVRVAIDSSVPTTVARVLGIQALETRARARCDLQGGPAVPIVARRYANPSGPLNGFVDHLASLDTSDDGEVDTLDPRGYGPYRVPASELAPGPQFSIYGNESKAHNESSFRGFVALDIRDFEGTTTRQYYNGVTTGMDENTVKDLEGEYLVTGYRGPQIPAVATPPTGATQLAALSGNSTSFVVQQFDDQFVDGDRLLLAVYDSIVHEIPDFTISPPVEIAIPSTTTTPFDGPSFTVSRNREFDSTVTLSLLGDAAATAASHPESDILPDPSVTPPATGDMTEPLWSMNVFQPNTQGTTVTMNDIQTSAVAPGIYTVWLEGESGDPYFQRHHVPVPVRVQTDANNDGDYNDAGDIKATRDFSLEDSVLDGSTGSIGGTITLPIRVSTTSASSTKWGTGASAVSLSWDTSSFTDCSLDPVALGLASITFGAGSVTPTTKPGTLSNLTINTAGLPQGCYLFDIRATGTNGDGQPVTHLETVRFTVATTPSSGQYVDVIGFAVFQIDDITSNDIIGHAVSGIAADPNDPTLRRAQRARLVPWS